MVRYWARYLVILGAVLAVLGVAGAVWCTLGVFDDEAYYRAAKALEKYPGNVLFTTEFKMAEPRHLLLLAGAWASAPLGLILGSMCVSLGMLLGREMTKRL